MPLPPENNSISAAYDGSQKRQEQDDQAGKRSWNLRLFVLEC